MNAYRDQYASLFRDGEGVTLIAISNDSPQTLHEWARDEDFPFLFGSDPEGDAYSAFGGDPWFTGISGSRALVEYIRNTPQVIVVHVAVKIEVLDLTQ